MFTTLILTLPLCLFSAEKVALSPFLEWFFKACLKKTVTNSESVPEQQSYVSENQNNELKGPRKLHKAEKNYKFMYGFVYSISHVNILTLTITYKL